jgi:hypothetical protein
LPIALDPNKASVLGFDGSLNYTASSGQLQNLASEMNFSGPSGSGSISSGTLSLNLKVDNSGKLVNGGSQIIQISGSADLDGDSVPDVTGTLLTGTIKAFGPQAAGPPTWSFNALFSIDGGLLTQSMIPLSGGGSTPSPFPLGQFGVILLSAENVTSGTLGKFTQDFSSDSVKTDVGNLLTPEPAAAVQLVCGSLILSSLFFFRRKRIIKSL